jgi:prepilin-type N-terminal cleavage/methylation domain-containing protein
MADQKGVTLIEVLVCLAILAALSAIAYPPLRGWYKRASIQSEVFLLVGCLHMAKMEAVKANSYVVIKATPTGFSAFVDDSRDWIRQTGERLLVDYRLRNGLTLDSNFPSHRMRFRGGRPGIRAGRFFLTDAEGRRMDVVMDIVGRIRVE